uniref:DUF4412 domain-containing protein n=1 Tax=Solibacter usitatus (strain Ellin6076) TaxID=234267 RepID=Q026E5_SOLUE
MFKNVVTIAGIIALSGSPLLADFTYQETSTITGGAMASMMRLAGVFSKQAREPIQSTVSVKGDKMLHRSANHASVIDLGSQTITSIDLQKKQYTVMTFEEMKQMIDQMAQKMKQNDKGEMSFKVSAKSTGKAKQVAGFDAKEMLLTMEMEAKDKDSGQKGGMTITTDMWIAPGIPGYQEVRDFYKRMSEKINWTPGGNIFMQNPQVSEGMAEVYKEVSKVDGVPVQQIITMGAAGTPPPADGSAAPAPQQQQQPAAERPSLGGALGGALGGKFGIGRKKTSSDQPPPSNTSNGQNPGSLLEMTTELSSFSSNAVDPSQFEVPAGFKKVDNELKKMR